MSKRPAKRKAAVAASISSTTLLWWEIASTIISSAASIRTALPSSAFQIKASVAIPQASNLLQDPKSIDNEVNRLVMEKLDRIASGYQTHGDKLKRTLETELELSDKVERCFFGHGDGYQNELQLLSTKLRERNQRLEECLGVNDRVIQRLLATTEDENPQPLFQEISFVPSATKEYGDHDDLGQLFGNGGVSGADGKGKEIDGYDTALQVIHHTSRDWTMGAAPCRDATIGWIVRAIVNYSDGDDYRLHANPLRVLVPGAGLGRLAYDVSTCSDLVKKREVHVEANDSSVTMAAAARQVLQVLQQQHGVGQQQIPIYPFLSDPQTNEIDARKRFEMEVFPDTAALCSYTHYNELRGAQPNLSFTVGDFVSTYSQEAKRNQYDVVATSFFIDTATNIYEYIFIVKHLLDSGIESSLWVNCGPLQWHPCALLRPTVEELKCILEVAGFELLAWEIADEAVAYRHPDDMGGNDLQARYTRSEAYRPLRFVARLNGGGTDDCNMPDLPQRIQYSEYLNEVAAPNRK